MLQFAVCDDQLEIADEIKVVLFAFAKEKGLFLDVDLFSDGKELLESKKKYDLIFLDIEMKKLNGIETAEKIRKYDMNVPIVFITSHCDYCQVAYKVHVFDFITKPFTEKDIYNVIGDFLSLTRGEDGSLIH